MNAVIVVTTDGAGHYTTRALGMPEPEAKGATETEAVARVRDAISAWLSAAQVVRAEELQAVANPWAAFAGAFKDDPQFGDFLEEMKRAREADEQP